MSVLVTGANGFIGKNLVKYLEENGIETVEHTGSLGDITDDECFDKLDLSDLSCCIHLAAKVFVPDSWKNPSVFYKTNLIGTLNVLELCRRKQIGLVYVSAYVYGIPEELPISEESQIVANNPYGHSKLLAEQLCEFYFNYFGVKVSIIRPFNVYGVGQNEKFLVPHIINQALSREFIEVMDLTPKRDYIYIDDLVKAIVSAMNSDKQFAIYNAGSGNSYSVKEIIDIVQGIVGSNKEVRSKNCSRENEVDDVVADCQKIKTELNWMPEHTLVSGLTKIIEDTKARVGSE